MRNPLPPLCFTRARVLCDGALHHRSLSVGDGRIAVSGGKTVDLSGYDILPGIIDLHGDGFERHIMPRPSAAFPIAVGLQSYDQEAAACGVTTAYLAQGWSWEGGTRGPDQAEALMTAMESYRPRALTDQRVQLRVETHLTAESNRLLQCVERFGVGYVVFNDHLDEGLAMSRMRPEAFAYWARKIGLTTENLMARLKAAQAEAHLVPRNLCLLADGFERLGVRFGSHDDPDAETREHYAMIGARIAEFPISRAAAAATRSMNDPVIMGAPNVVRGGSQSGNISATDLVRAGLCDVLVSDYHLPALPLAAWRLVDLGLMDLARAWAMISSAPARVLGLSDRGEIAEGKRADLVIVNAETRVIEATICGGRLAYAAGDVALRLMGAEPRLRVAAE